MSSCPSDQSLKRLGTVSMSASEFAALEKHIEECGGCQAILERLVRDGWPGETGASMRTAEPLQVPALPGFVMEDELGRGSMGVVYRAWQPNLARHVAIKFLKQAGAAEQRARWLREAQALSRVRNRGIVQIYEIGEAEGSLFLVLELIRGGSLKDRLTKPLPPQIAARFAETMARAVDEIHKAGLLHLDLKPSNVLLDGPSSPLLPRPGHPGTPDARRQTPDSNWDAITPMIGDFGIARPQDDPLVSANGSRCLEGTPSYMAPEQIAPLSGQIGPPADVYAVGATLYHLLTGRPPFLAATATETLEQVCRLDPVPPRQLISSIPRDLETVCLKCLKKSPKDRYASAAALADDLRRFLDGEPVKARQVGPLGRARRWCRRKPAIASLVAVLLLTMLGGMTGIMLEWRRVEAARKSAVASDMETRDLLGELVESSPVVPWRGYLHTAPGIEALQKAETHCKKLVQKDPGDLKLRIALTNLYGGLGTLYAQEGQAAEAQANFRRAQGLWQALATQVAGNPVCRDWLAITYTWQTEDDYPRYLESYERAEAIWEKLADERPGDLELIHKLWDCRFRLTTPIAVERFRNDCLGLLEKRQADLRQLLRQNPADNASRRQLALTCFCLGEIYAHNESPDKAASSWRESYEQYNIVAKQPGNDLVGPLLLAISCSRLVQPNAADPYYRQAVPVLERSARQIDALLKQEPQNDWLQELLLEDYCCLALCHANAGQVAKAEQISNDGVCLLANQLNANRVEPVFAVEQAKALVTLAQRLRDARQPTVALRLARQAATLCSKLAVYPSRELAFPINLSVTLSDSSALANQLGDPALALQQAELARRAAEDWVRAALDGYRREDLVSTAWIRIAKARWSLGQRDQALAALRKSAAIQKRVFEREPSNPGCRRQMSGAYKRLVFYSARAGDLSGAAHASRERLKLWPGDAKRLSEAADDFAALAEQVTARSRGPLTRADQAERAQYLAESRRLRGAAHKAVPQADHDLRAER